jgi:hypothetical protein
LPWVCRCFAPTATLLSLHQTRFECELLPDSRSPCTTSLRLTMRCSQPLATVPPHSTL